jgi:tetratricopeptide (TPR) repeat protein
MNSPGWRVFSVLIICATQAASGSEPWEELRRNGTAAREQGRYPEAKRDLEGALATFPFDPQDLRRADLDDELASVYEYLGESASAERAYRDAVVILDRRADATAGFRSTILGNFGLFRANQGRFNEARELLEAALAGSRKALGERDFRTAYLKSGLAQLYLKEGRLASAEPLLLDAIEVQRTALPPSHLDRIVSESGLGYLYMIERRYDKAEAILQQVSEDARRLGESHPTLAFTLVNLANLYRAEGKSARSEPLFRRAMAIYEASLGPDSLKVAEARLNIGIDSIASRKFAIAEGEIERALGIFRRIDGPDNLAAALAEYRLAVAYAGEGKYDEAESVLQHALAILEKTWPDGHFVVADCLHEMAEVERLRRRYANAELLYQRAIAVYEKCGLAGSSGLAVALQQYARLLRTGRTDEAKALEKRAQELQKSVHAFQ